MAKNTWSNFLHVIRVSDNLVSYMTIEESSFLINFEN